MKIAAIYDIHGNLPALEAVIKVIKEIDPDHIVVGGDVVTGPMPVECLEALKELNESYQMSYIHGNAESEVLRAVAGEEPRGFTENNDAIAQWVASKLSAEQLEEIKSWSLTCTIENAHGDEILFCHATPQNDIDVFTSNSSDEKVERFFEGVTNPMVVCGHTHMQIERELENTRLINAGSVGMSFTSPGAYWLLIADGEVSFNHTMYNLEDAAARLSKTDFPNVEAFVANNVLSTKSEDDAIAMLTRLAMIQDEQRVLA